MENEKYESIKSKIRKLHALAEKGSYGEMRNAKILIDKLCRQYNLTLEEIQIEIPDGKRAKWVNGVLTLVDEQSKVNCKFKIGDKVKIKRVNQVQTITNIALLNGNPVYKTDGNSTLTEEQIELYTKPKDITERIKTFEDAMTWCGKNGKNYLCEEYCTAMDVGLFECASDIAAYLKLRIITCALNEGWKPTFEYGEDRWYIYTDACDTNDINTQYKRASLNYQESSRLLFKSKELAEYAATQFKDIYMDFCYKK